MGTTGRRFELGFLEGRALLLSIPSLTFRSSDWFAQSLKPLMFAGCGVAGVAGVALLLSISRSGNILGRLLTAGLTKEDWPTLLKDEQFCSVCDIGGSWTFLALPFNPHTGWLSSGVHPG